MRLPVALALAAASGVILWLAIPPADLGPLAFVAFVPLLIAVRGAGAGRGALLGFVFGAAYFGVLMSWLVPVSILGWSILALGSAAWMAIIFAHAAAVWRDDRPLRTALAVGAGWVAIEWLRGMMPFGGFSWGGLGYTQHDNPLLLPLASLGGVWTISFVVMAANVLVLAAALRVREGGWLVAARLLSVAAVLAIAPGLVPLAEPGGPAIDVAVIQGNVPIHLAIESRIIEDRVVAEDHARLHRSLAGDPPNLAIWPENALDLDPTRDASLRELVGGAIRDVGVFTLVGAITESDDGRLFNDNLLYDRSGQVVGRYTKNHLVPFGEYVPFRDLLEGRVPQIDEVREDLTAGTEPGHFDIPAGSFATAICFENAFPGLVRRYVRAETDFIAISTNNATFRRSPAARQHIVMSELRAVENGRWVVHAALTGKSAFIDARGQVLETTELFEQAVLRRGVPAGEGRTVFNVIGGWLPAVYVLGALAAVIAPRRRRRRVPGPLPEAPRTAVILPTYEEADTIADAIAGVLAAGERVRVIVVDDASPDGTAGIVRTLGEPRVTLLERPGKQGLASAYRLGFEQALAAGDDLVVEMDADLSHDPADLPSLLEAAGDHHLVIGSRYVPGGSIPDWALGRRILSRGGNLYARILLGLPVADATSGYRVFRRDLLRTLVAEGVRTDGYAFQVELAYRAWRLGYAVGEVPITFRERRAGRSKLSRGIIVEALRKVLGWAVRDRLLRRGHGLDAGRPAGVE